MCYENTSRMGKNIIVKSVKTSVSLVTRSETQLLLRILLTIPCGWIQVWLNEQLPTNDSPFILTMQQSINTYCLIPSIASVILAINFDLKPKAYDKMKIVFDNMSAPRNTSSLVHFHFSAPSISQNVLLFNSVLYFFLPAAMPSLSYYLFRLIFLAFLLSFSDCFSFLSCNFYRLFVRVSCFCLAQFLSSFLFAVLSEFVFSWWSQFHLAKHKKINT